MIEINKIYFIHEGRAYYPSVIGNRDYFGNNFQCEELSYAEARLRTDLHRAICWHFMGFYPDRLPAALTIHDYKSVSVEPFSIVKDFAKTYLNAKPDIRLITPYMARRQFFKDDVLTLVQDMGVPDHIMRYRPAVPPEPVYDFSYVGVMARERASHVMIDSFLRRFGDSKTFLLIGKPEDYLVNRYKQNKNVIFVGQKPQGEAFNLMLQTRVAVCYFPNHRPHIHQTPTKLLDAAGLGLRILANEQPMNREKSAEYGINVRWCDGRDMFKDVPDALEWPDNRGVDPAPFLWTTLNRQAGIEEAMTRILGARNIALPQAA